MYSHGMKAFLIVLASGSLACSSTGDPANPTAPHASLDGATDATIDATIDAAADAQADAPQSLGDVDASGDDAPSTQCAPHASPGDFVTRHEGGTEAERCALVGREQCVELAPNLRWAEGTMLLTLHAPTDEAALLRQLEIARDGRPVALPPGTYDLRPALPVLATETAFAFACTAPTNCISTMAAAGAGLDLATMTKRRRFDTDLFYWAELLPSLGDRYVLDGDYALLGTRLFRREGDAYSERGRVADLPAVAGLQSGDLVVYGTNVLNADIESYVADASKRPTRYVVFDRSRNTVVVAAKAEAEALLTEEQRQQVIRNPSMIHGFYYLGLGRNLVFEKVGWDSKLPFLIRSVEESLAVYTAEDSPFGLQHYAQAVHVLRASPARRAAIGAPAPR